MSTELRDRFFALSAGHAPAGEVDRYRAQVDATDTEPARTLDGLAISWHPTARHKAVRFVDAERIDADVRALFARPSPDAPHLAAVFVDPAEFSFRTFENILPLDHHFEGAGLEFALTDRTEFAGDAYRFSVRLPDAARARLERLDTLNLYVPPLNAATRGGDRFIFHSALLAEALTRAVTEAMPEPLMDGFSHVNPVFRCNRFEPGDDGFHRHRDTPYHDAARHHVSRYTVLLYLTGGSAAPALDLVEGGALAEIDPFTCVIFDQRYEHEGAPYRDGRKVFLRTELVFTDPEVTHDPEIGALFSKACYWTGESVFAPELARHADACYNKVAAAHWSGLTPGAAREPFVHKRFQGVDFIANGYDFWFAKSDALSLTECAAITLLDYFNCKLGDTAFRAKCESTVIEADGTDWIPAFLKGKQDGQGGSAVPEFDKANLFPEPEDPDESGDACCSFHSGGIFDPTRDEETIDYYERAQTFTKAHVMPAPILMLGEDVVLDPGKFVIRGNQIHVLGPEPLGPVNFAACQSSEPEFLLDVAVTVDAAHFLVPPIIFTESESCYHLQFDFFRNSWMVEHHRSTVPIPMIDELGDETPQWIKAADRTLLADLKGEHGADLWWADDPSLVKELYDEFSEVADEWYDEDWDEED
ncbi:hypothetical protein ACQP1W_12265 [Spirillospora sp. CA-255316]